ncbi:hypothetical protein Y032_0112g272 [Ancylostoma ceylanicum]|uniref:Uncharacterized protein n=1 Tax=Ancylostoma ceylanicum TaxID=53326 RepID=A0A016TDW7_9BILA|nr:hypothetical protein Y032_0112g272 [Ancylostoma ceylanicum]
MSGWLVLQPKIHEPLEIWSNTTSLRKKSTQDHEEKQCSYYPSQIATPLMPLLPAPPEVETSSRGRVISAARFELGRNVLPTPPRPAGRFCKENGFIEI